MSWHKIKLSHDPTKIDPNVVHIAELARAVYLRENKPKGFGMFHATRAMTGVTKDTLLIYLTPLATEMCPEIAEEGFTLEPCEAPACDEPDVAFILGDPVTMSDLKQRWEPEPGSLEWRYAQARAAQAEAEEKAAIEAELAAIQAEMQGEPAAEEAPPDESESASA